jgi:putative endopeptidase
VELTIRRALLWTIAGAALLPCLVAGCGDVNAPAPRAAAVHAAPTPEDRKVLGEFGIDTAGMDRGVAPGDDFFGYANGAWLRATDIPADRSSYGTLSVVQEQAEKDTRAIVEAAAADAAAAGDRKKIGDAYAAYMDEAQIEAQGLAPLQSDLDAIAAITDRKGLSRALGASLRADVDLLNYTDWYTDRLFGLWFAQHLRKPDAVVPYLVQGGLGMPDRDFYLGGGRMADLRLAYLAHIAKIFTLAGVKDPAASAARIVALETAIARVHATQVETGDVERGNNEWLAGDFPRKAPGIDWREFLAGAQLGSQPTFIVWQPRAVMGISRLVASESLEVWKEYLAFHALDRASAYLPKAFADERFAFYGTTLNGTPQQRDRWKRALGSVNAALGEAVGRLYVEQHFSPATKARADAMVQEVVRAFGRRIDAVEWMSPQAKAHARAKLAGIRVGMGYPSKWRDYSALEIRRNDALGNAQRASLFAYQHHLAKLGKPADREEWYLLPHEVNALNLPLENRLIFPAAILQPPFFDAAADDAVNYGATGATIGHEISHSFDNMGALFDETGRLENWWTAEDRRRFREAGAMLVAQYDAYRPFPDLAVNGKLTLGENIADVAGLATAHDAYRASQEGKPAQVLGGFTPDQRFFLGYAQSNRSKEREQAQRNALLSDSHAPDQYRAVTVRNQDAWYAAFDVHAGQRLYLAPEKRVSVW